MDENKLTRIELQTRKLKYLCIKNLLEIIFF
jgi:hypothetical protein